MRVIRFFFNIPSLSWRFLHWLRKVATELAIVEGAIDSEIDDATEHMSYHSLLRKVLTYGP